jgi:hypothetical protein
MVLLVLIATRQQNQKLVVTKSTRTQVCVLEAEFFKESMEEWRNNLEESGKNI